MKNNQPWLIKNLKKNRLYNISEILGKNFLKSLLKMNKRLIMIICFLLGNANRIISSSEDQINFLKAINELKSMKE